MTTMTTKITFVRPWRGPSVRNTVNVPLFQVANEKSRKHDNFGIMSTSGGGTGEDESKFYSNGWLAT